jgi:hypothetical protein
LKESKHNNFFIEFLVDIFTFVSVLYDSACFAVLYIVAGLMKIQVKVEAVLMLLEHFMVAEVTQMRMRSVCSVPLMLKTIA